jgi:hypothetical protein
MPFNVVGEPALNTRNVDGDVFEPSVNVLKVELNVNDVIVCAV